MPEADELNRSITELLANAPDHHTFSAPSVPAEVAAAGVSPATWLLILQKFGPLAMQIIQMIISSLPVTPAKVSEPA